MGNRYEERHGRNPFASVNEMVNTFGFNEGELTEEKLDYRMGLLKEEYQETEGAWRVGNAEEWVDGHIDIIVVAMGNLAIAGVNGERAFNEVMNANMKKELGSRGKAGGVEGMEIFKPKGWIPPDHSDNHGKLDSVMTKVDEILAEIDEIFETIEEG